MPPSISNRPAPSPSRHTFLCIPIGAGFWAGLGWAGKKKKKSPSPLHHDGIGFLLLTRGRTSPTDREGGESTPSFSQVTIRLVVSPSSKVHLLPCPLPFLHLLSCTCFLTLAFLHLLSLPSLVFFSSLLSRATADFLEEEGGALVAAADADGV
mmetsp:Transcript_2238/g.7484  ORF Transcript_2238/g.7484 Transcript_2238/m.7484 type:complete len:153 (-) Transcript_2238:97-555(-)